MAGRPAMTAAGHNAAGAIARAAANLCAEAGAAGVTVRGVAAAAGVAPSAVIYHFANREGLLAAAHAAMTEAIAEWMADARAASADGRGNGLSAEALAAATAIAFLRDHRAALVALQELNRAALRGDLALGDREADWSRVVRFWSAVTGTGDGAGETGPIWSVILEGAISIAALEVDPIVRDALIVDLVARAGDRIARRPLRTAPAVAPARTPPARPDHPPGRQRIIEAVIALIGEAGVGNLTHRNIAARAGVAVGTVSNAYGDRQAMIVDAFDDLRWRGIDAVILGPAPPRHYLSEIVFTPSGDLRTELALIHAVGAALVRNPDLGGAGPGGLADSVRHLREGMAERWLAMRGIHGVDAIDAALWVAVTAAIVERAICLPPAGRRHWADRAADDHLAALFGPPPPSDGVEE
ncbi:MAG: TetR family transcriptional regulator [Sphingomonas sp.]|nr:TetR family transcriptional regulator [Sphingomonas sp.]